MLKFGEIMCQNFVNMIWFSNFVSMIFPRFLKFDLLEFCEFNLPEFCEYDLPEFGEYYFCLDFVAISYQYLKYFICS